MSTYVLESYSRDFDCPAHGIRQSRSSVCAVLFVDPATFVRSLPWPVFQRGFNHVRWLWAAEIKYLEPIPVGQVVVAGRFPPSPALRLLAIARYDSSPRLVPDENHLRHN